MIVKLEMTTHSCQIPKLQLQNQLNCFSPWGEEKGLNWIWAYFITPALYHSCLIK